MEPSTPGTMPFDVATSVKEIAKGHKQIWLLRVLAAAAQPGGSTWPENAEELFDGVMNCLGVALSTLNPAAKPTNTHRQPEPSTEHIAQTHAASNKYCKSEELTRKRKSTGAKHKKNNLSRKRMPTDSWTITTSQPMNDAYQWRKYGEKKIHGAQFPRCYYRCAYRDEEGCQAMKQVQQANNSSPPNFTVTNIRQHTCTMAEIVRKRGFAIVMANSSSSANPGSYPSGVRRSSSIPPAFPFTEETPELDVVHDEEIGGCSSTGCPDQQDQRVCEQEEVMNREFCDGAPDTYDAISSMLCPLSPCSMHLEMSTHYPGATSGTGEVEYVDDLWLF